MEEVYFHDLTFSDILVSYLGDLILLIFSELTPPSLDLRAWLSIPSGIPTGWVRACLIKRIPLTAYRLY